MTMKPWQTIKPWRVRFWETHLSFVPDYVAKTNVWYLHPRAPRDYQNFTEWLIEFCPHAVVIKQGSAIDARYWLNKHAEGFYGCYAHDPGVPWTNDPGGFHGRVSLDEATVFRFRDASMAFDIKMRFG